MNAEFVRQPMTQSGSRKAALGQDIATTNRKNVAELPNAKIVPPVTGGTRAKPCVTHKLLGSEQ